MRDVCCLKLPFLHCSYAEMLTQQMLTQGKIFMHDKLQDDIARLKEELLQTKMMTGLRVQVRSWFGVKHDHG